MYKDFNQVRLSGTIVNIYVPQMNPMRMVLTIRSGINHPKVFLTDHIAKYAYKSFKVGDRIGLIGNIQSSKKKIGTVSTIFVTEVFIPNDDAPDENHFYLSGEILGIKTFTNKNVSRILVKTEFFGRKSIIPVSFYQPNPRLFWIISDNGYLSVSGTVQTTKQKIKGGDKFRYYQNFVADFPKG